MVQFSEFSLQGIQASAWVPGKELRPKRILKQALRDWDDAYDAEPISLPIPPDAPGEIPSVILASRDGSLQLQAARERINLLWQRQSEADVDLRKTYATFAERLAAIIMESNIPAGRLAAIVTRVASNPDPGRNLARQFCRDEWLKQPLNRPEGFELHAHKVFSLHPELELSVNSWIRIKTARNPGEGFRYIVVEQDINTLAEDILRNRFLKAEISPFYDKISAELEHIMELYFPASPSKQEA